MIRATTRDMSSYLATRMGGTPLISPESTVRAGFSRELSETMINKLYFDWCNRRGGQRCN